MNELITTINPGGDYDETILQLARHLGTSKLRRKIFNAVYGRGMRARSKKQLMEAAKIWIVGTNSQQAQNELDHLTKHHLVVRVENNGLVKDGSRYLYQKDAFVRANRSRIVRLADDKKEAAKIATKRRPITEGTLIVRRVTRQQLKRRKHLTVLYLVANPDPKKPLRVDAEMRRVQESVKRSAYRDNITIEYRPAADLDSLIDGLNDHRPQIVHFSGHGGVDGLATDTGKVVGPTSGDLPFELLAKALAATDHPPEIVVLNSCESTNAKKYLLPVAKIVISMRTSVTDVAATAFATRFYAAIASGQSVGAAFAQGKVAVEAVSISEVDTPELHSSGKDAGRIILT